MLREGLSHTRGAVLRHVFGGVLLMRLPVHARVPSLRAARVHVPPRPVCGQSIAHTFSVMTVGRTANGWLAPVEIQGLAKPMVGQSHGADAVILQLSCTTSSDRKLRAGSDRTFGLDGQRRHGAAARRAAEPATNSTAAAADAGAGQRRLSRRRPGAAAAARVSLGCRLQAAPRAPPGGRTTLHELSPDRPAPSATHMTRYC